MLETIRPLVEIRVLFLLLPLTVAACGGDDGGDDCPTCPTPDPNSAPDVTIDRPSAGSEYLTGESVYLTGGGSDSEDGDLSGADLVWRSSEDGRLGTGETLHTELSAGAQTLRLIGTDGDGAADTASVQVTVEEPEARTNLQRHGGTAEVTQSTWDGEPGHIIDGDPRTKWQVEGNPSEIVAIFHVGSRGSANVVEVTGDYLHVGGTGGGRDITEYELHVQKPGSEGWELATTVETSVTGDEDGDASHRFGQAIRGTDFKLVVTGHTAPSGCGASCDVALNEYHLVGQFVEGETTDLQLRPGRDTLLVNETRRFRVVRVEGGGERDTVPPGEVTWSIGNVSVASVTGSGVVEGEGAGTTTLGATVDGQTAEATVRVDQLAPPEQATRQVSGQVQVPAARDTASVYVSTVVGGAADVGSDGNYTTTVSESQTSTVYAKAGDEMFGLTVVGSGASTADLDPASTAVGLVFQAPLFASAPPPVTADIKEVLRGLPEVESFAAEIEAQIDDHGALPDTTDAAFRSAYRDAVEAAVAEIADRAGLDGGNASVHTTQTIGNPNNRSGLKVALPDPGEIAPQLPDLTLTIQNQWQRYVDMHALPVDSTGELLGDPPPFGRLALRLRSAEVVPDVSDLGGWLDFLGGEWEPSENREVTIRFTQDEPRLMVSGYGAGVAELTPDTAAIAPDDRPRWIVPTVFTAVFDLVLPQMQLASGLTKANLGADKLAQAEDLLFSRAGTQLQNAALACVREDTDADAFTLCVVESVHQVLGERPELLRELLAMLLPSVSTDELRQKLTESVLTALLPNWQLVDPIADLVATGTAVGMAELREEFPLRYNALLGVTRGIEKVSGDDQTGPAGETLPDPVRVRVPKGQDAGHEDAWVAWTAGDDGSVPDSVTVTNAEGYTDVPWTLADRTGEQTLTATLAGMPQQVTFTATAVSSQPAAPDTLGFVANTGSDDVTVFDAGTGSVVATVSVGEEPTEVAVTPDGETAYVPNAASGTVSVIDVKSMSETETIPVDESPVAVAIAPSGDVAYVANRGSHSVSVIDLATDRVTETLSGLEGPLDLTVTPDGDRIYVTTADTDNASVIDAATHSVVATVPTGSWPWGIASDPTGSSVYVTDNLSNEFVVVATSSNTVESRVPVGQSPRGVAVTPDGTEALVANTGSDDVSVVDLGMSSVTATVSVGSSVKSVDVSPDGGNAYTANFGSDDVSVVAIGSRSVVGTIPAGIEPSHVEVAPSVAPETQNTPPTVRIEQPEDGATFQEGEQITFQGSAEDEEDGPITGEDLVWRSDLDGQLGTGETVTEALSVGEHRITLTATDSQGATATDQIAVTVDQDTGTGSLQVSATTSGEDQDTDGYTITVDGSQTASIGPDGSTTFSGLATGEHEVALSGKKSNCSVEGSNPRTVTVEAGGTVNTEFAVNCTGENQPPTVSIEQPTDGATFQEGEEITFRGSADDREDGQLSGDALVWASNQDGQLGTGERIATTLSPGTHSVTLEATDSDGATGSAEVTVTVGSTISWTVMEIQAAGQLNDVWVAGPQSVFAVGNSGTVFHYDGTAWKAQETFTDPLGGIWGAGDDDVYAVGAHGLIAHYDGNSWERVSQPGQVDENLRDVWGSGPDNVFAVGEAGSIYRYDGVELERLETPTEADLLGVWGSSASNAYAVGASALLRFDGSQWSLVSQTGGIDIWVSPSGRAFLAVNGGIVERTEQGFIRHNATETGMAAAAVGGTAVDDVFAIGSLEAEGMVIHHDGSETTVVGEGFRSGWGGLWVGSSHIFAVGGDGAVLHGRR